jgi:hypothetical protein
VTMDVTGRRIMLASELDRLNTFHNWRYWKIIAPTDLARNGFIPTGKCDEVFCVFCNVCVKNWHKNDSNRINSIHLIRSPKCSFARNNKTTKNIPLSMSTERTAVPAAATTTTQAVHHKIKLPGHLLLLMVALYMTIPNSWWLIMPILYYNRAQFKYTKS